MSFVWRQTVFCLLILSIHCYVWCSLPRLVAASTRTWTRVRKLEALNRTRDLWYHGYDNYMQHAFPADELRPLSCRGRGPDWENPNNFGNNDVAANVSLTLIDVLDTLVVLQNYHGFAQAVRNVIDHVTFDVDTKPQVFEITIRVLGGLLSGHIFASDSKSPYWLPWYRGELLQLAQELGERLLPAFRTSTGIPYARTNLRYGVPKGESVESCTAGAGSLIIEFAVLSRLTGDDRFERAATKAFFAIWNRRSDINLVGNTMNIWSGAWTPPLVAGIGAGIDSFYEYSLKWYIISGESEFLDVFQEAYAAIMRYSRSADGFWFHSVYMNSGELAYATVDSLSSFWPGLQVLAGDVENAIKSHLIYWNLWKRYSGMPEVFDINFSKPVALQYPLRPEFIESTYYLYRATRDSFYLDVGERVLQDIILRAKVPCGLTGITDLSNNIQDDRMESFVLSETLKYLFLLFDEENPLHSDHSNLIFTTEGHLLTLNTTYLKPISKIRRKIRGIEHRECPAYSAPLEPLQELHSGLTSSIHARPDFEWARHLSVGHWNQGQLHVLEATDKPFWHPQGWCEVPRVEIYTYEFILSSAGEQVLEDPNPGQDKLRRVEEGYVVVNATGIRVNLVSRIDGKGYDINKLGPNPVRAGQKVYMTDNEVVRGWNHQVDPIIEQPTEVQIRFHLSHDNPLIATLSGWQSLQTTLASRAFTSLFGGNLASETSSQLEITSRLNKGLQLMHIRSNPFGCVPYKSGIALDHYILVVHRGDCTFVQKLRQAALVGADGVLVVSDSDIPINPSSDEDDHVDDLVNVILLVLPWSTGEQVLEMMAVAEGIEATVTVQLESSLPVSQVNTPGTRGNTQILEHPSQTKAPAKQHLWLAGRPILNMVIMV